MENEAKVTRPETADDQIVNTVAWFAAEMRAKLFENRHKGGWRDCTTAYLLRRLKREIGELEGILVLADGLPPANCLEIGRAINMLHDQVARESADIANFAMMIADPARKPGVERCGCCGGELPHPAGHDCT